MNDYRSEDNPYCYFHPRQLVVGVCSHCLKERLLILASEQGQLSATKDSKKPFRYFRRRPTINRLKVFALTTFLHLLEPRHSISHCKDGSDDANDEDSTASFEDSFISIKFEDNGHAAWDCKKTISITETSVDANTTSSIKDGKQTKIIVEHKKHSSALRWRKRIGQFLQLARWKTSNKANTCHIGLGSKVDGFKGRKSWIENLTRTTTVD